MFNENFFIFVFPAPAGMNRYDHCMNTFATSVPRACGDEPTWVIWNATEWTCSPRLRG
uniref:Uncharacterized protein n=1 Tax=mine drainage metagenome TaxID=410659 RepID=E6QU48_9ZZZZ